eukprot:4182315-Amphidinium_carterae.1
MIDTDSSRAKCMAQQLGMTTWTKHVDIHYLHVQQRQYEGTLSIHKLSNCHKVGTNDRPAEQWAQSAAQTQHTSATSTTASTKPPTDEGKAEEYSRVTARVTQVIRRLNKQKEHYK